MPPTRRSGIRREDALGVKKTDNEESFGLEFFQTDPDHMSLSSDGWGATDTDFAVPTSRTSSADGSYPSNSDSSSEPAAYDYEQGVVACSKRKRHGLRERDGTVPQLDHLEHHLPPRLLHLDDLVADPASDSRIFNGPSSKENEPVEFLRLELNCDSVISAWEKCLDGRAADPCSTSYFPFSGEPLDAAKLLHLPGIPGPNDAPVMSRAARLERYKEKKRTRQFSTKIRYTVRKLNAERRPRMKGRFVKQDDYVDDLIVGLSDYNV